MEGGLNTPLSLRIAVNLGSHNKVYHTLRMDPYLVKGSR